MRSQLQSKAIGLNSTISATESSLIDSIRAAYEEDPVIGRDAPIAKKVRQLAKLVKRNELWYKDERIYVPDVSSIKTQLMHEAHDAQHAGHLGTEKTVKLLCRSYIWPRMHEDVKSYVTSCVSCQQNKSINAMPQGLLQPLPVPNECWQQCTMDLITQLPCTKRNNDAIIVVVDKFSKLTHCWATTTTVGAVELAKQFFREIVRLHGFPRSIVSDRDARFTSLFWNELWRMSGTKLAMSTAYHPQSDGQTERQNRTLEEMLRAFVSVKQDDWDEHLAAAELAINNSTQTSSKETPFFLTYGRHVKTPLDLALPQSTNQSAIDVVETLKDAHALAREKLIEAQQRQSKYANEHRADVSFAVGDRVMLSTRNLRLKNRAPKLDAKHIGPYTVTECIGKVAYRIELPVSLQKMHDVFHVSVLHKYRDGAVDWPDRASTHRPDPELIDNEQEWEVDAILKHRRTRGNRNEYLIAWKGYPIHEATWQDESELNCDELLQEYKDKQRTVARVAHIDAHDAAGCDCDSDDTDAYDEDADADDSNSDADVICDHVATGNRIVDADRCIAMNKNGTRCRCRTRRSQYCWMHLQQLHNLRIRESNISGAGLGLFVGKKPMAKRTRIADYSGPIIHYDPEENDGPTGEYMLETRKGTVVDGASSKNIASFANDCRSNNKRTNECKGNNMEFKIDKRTSKARVETTKKVEPMQELHVPYGNDYWRGKANSARVVQQIDRVYEQQNKRKRANRRKIARKTHAGDA